MQAVDLFAGAGGFSTGAAMAGVHLLGNAVCPVKACDVINAIRVAA